VDRSRKRHAFALLRETLSLDAGLREAFVAARCGEDAALANWVRERLASDGRAGALLDRNVGELAAQLVGQCEDGGLPAGTQVGAWRVLHELGRGGMGSVFLAERDGDGYVQQGALKLIKRGMDSDEVLARFRRERQILSRLAHPNIARLLDGGIADDGRPFLVMEYVIGEPLEAWARRTHAGIDACIGAFLPLCDAVAYAHRQLVVHRDIKPGNVLVDTSGQPKLLDFGIAKVLEDTGPADRTATVARFVSRAWAAPEQLAGGAVTTATDVYQLGVLLFELLGGTRFADAAQAAARPSQRLALARERAGDAAPAMAVRARQLRGDAGIVIARATDADPARRYATVEALADDLRRWRRGQPILARPDSSAYRLRRFVGRHRTAVALGALALAAALGGAGAALWQARQAAAEARLARSAQAFLSGVFDASAPDTAAGARVTARELLDRGSERVRGELADQPRLRAEMLLTLGTLYRQLGQYEQAAGLLTDARATLATLPARGDAAERAALESAIVERELGHADSALPLFDAVLAKHPAPSLRARALAERALQREKQGQLESALEDARAAARLDAERGAEGRADRARDRQIEALMLSRLGHFEAAIEAFDETIATAESAWGADDTRTAQMHNDYGVMLIEKGRAKDGEREVRKALDARRRRLGENHTAVAESLQVLGSALRQQGRLDEAQAALDGALAIQRGTLGERHIEVANTLNSLGLLAISRRRYAEAERSLGEATAIYRERGFDTSVAGTTTASNWGQALMQLGRYDEAEPLLRGALERHTAMLGERHPVVLSAANGLALLELRRGRTDVAQTHARRAVKIADAVLGPGRDTAAVHLTLAIALLRGRNAADAIAEADVASAMLERAGAGTDPRMMRALAIRADALLALGRESDARPLAERVLRERSERTPDDTAAIAAAHALLARVARAQKRGGEADREQRAAMTLLATIEAPDPDLVREISVRAMD